MDVLMGCYKPQFSHSFSPVQAFNSSLWKQEKAKTRFGVLLGEMSSEEPFTIKLVRMEVQDALAVMKCIPLTTQLLHYALFLSSSVFHSKNIVPASFDLGRTFGKAHFNKPAFWITPTNIV